MLALSTALVVATIAVTAVVAVRLVRQAGVLKREAETAARRLGPLLEELQDEVAVTATELAHLQARGVGGAPER